MKKSKKGTTIVTGVATAMLGLAIVGLASCTSGDETTAQLAPGGSAALQGPLVFVHNSTARTTSVLALRGDTGNSVIKTLGNGFPELPGHPNGAYNGNAPGDMQFSEGEWVFVSVGGIVPGPGVAADTVGSSVALIDPLSGATPIFEDLLQIGERPVHMYRDPTDGEVMWSMIDGNATTGIDSVSATIKDTGAVVDCSTTGGGAVTILHNSHVGSGGNVPEIIAKVCLLAAGHKVAAFSSGTGIPRLTFVSSTTAGEISVIDNQETLSGGAANPNYLKLIARIDLCDTAKEASRPAPAVCDTEEATPLTLAFSPNNSNPHGIRFSVASKKIYSIQENYRTLIEVDPALVVAGVGNNKAAITRELDLAGKPYTSYGITPDGRFLFLRGVDMTTDPDHLLGKLGVIDLTGNPTDPLIIDEFTLPEMTDVVPSTFKFAPNGQRLYMLAANTATGTGNQPVNQRKNLLFAYDSSTFPAAPTLLRPIGLLSTTGNHNFDIYADGAAGTGTAKYVVVSNGSTENSVSIINATTNQITQSVLTGNGTSTVMVYYPDAAVNDNQATASLTGRSTAKPPVLPERLDDYGMPE